jgi:hypothetical protein
MNKAGAMIGILMAVVIFIVLMPLFGRAAANECTCTTAPLTTTTTTAESEGIYLVLKTGSDLTEWENGERLIKYELNGQTAPEIITYLRSIYPHGDDGYNFIIFKVTDGAFDDISSDNSYQTENGYTYAVIALMV